MCAWGNSMTLPPRMLGGLRDRDLLHTSKVVFRWLQPLGLASLVLDAERWKADIVMEPTHIRGPVQCPWQTRETSSSMSLDLRTGLGEWTSQKLRCIHSWKHEFAAWAGPPRPEKNECMEGRRCPGNAHKQRANHCWIMLPVKQNIFHKTLLLHFLF